MQETSNNINSLAHTKWNCKYHIVFAPKYRRKIFYEEHRLEERDITKAVRMERSGNNRRRSVSGSHTYSCIVATQNERFGVHGIFERKKCDDNISKMGKFETREKRGTKKEPKPRADLGETNEH